MENDDTGRKSWHTEYGAFLNHDRIYLFNSKKTSLDLTIGKKWTRESADDSVESTNVYYATLAQKISPHWNTWVGYYREDFTTDVFTYDQPDMAKELRNGLQYIMMTRTALPLSTAMIWTKRKIMKQDTAGRISSAAGSFP